MNEPIAAPAIQPPVPFGAGRFAELVKPPVTPWLERPPTQDELPYEDGEPMETDRHLLQIYLLRETLTLHWVERRDFFVGGNMFVYFSPDQDKTEHYRGPDFFVVLGVDGLRERKSWVVWEEKKGPDVVVEFLSDRTARFDRTEKKRIYETMLRVPEYFWFDPFSGELAGFTLRDGKYFPIVPDERGRLVSQQLGLALTYWTGEYLRVTATWLRWETLDGTLLPTDREAKQVAEQQAQVAEQRAELLAAKLRELGIDPDALT